MNAVVEKALGQWGMAGAAYRLVAARENGVYEVRDGEGRVALRLHRRGYRSDAQLRSELAWMAAVAEGGLSVPAPIRAQDGALLAHIDGVQVDVLTWLTGQTMAEALDGLAPADRSAVFFDLGRDMARLHQRCDAWPIPPDFERPCWDRQGLLGEAPLWDRFWENPDLTEMDRALFAAFRELASVKLAEIGPTLDYGLIHADLIPDNVMVDGRALRFIDFDDGGYGYRLFDVATVLLKQRNAPDYPQRRDTLVEGYRSVRPLAVEALDLFLALRAATYVGWNIVRMNEPGGIERNARFIASLRSLAAQYMAGSAP